MKTYLLATLATVATPALAVDEWQQSALANYNLAAMISDFCEVPFAAKFEANMEILMPVITQGMDRAWVTKIAAESIAMFNHYHEEYVTVGGTSPDVFCTAMQATMELFYQLNVYDDQFNPEETF